MSGRGRGVTFVEELGPTPYSKMCLLLFVLEFVVPTELFGPKGAESQAHAKRRPPSPRNWRRSDVPDGEGESMSRGM